jgi:hypothetical protein
MFIHIYKYVYDLFHLLKLNIHMFDNLLTLIKILCICIYVCVSICIYVYVSICIYVYMYIFIFIHTHIYDLFHLLISNIHMFDNILTLHKIPYVYVYMYICIYLYIYIYSYTYMIYSIF